MPSGLLRLYNRWKSKPVDSKDRVKENSMFYHLYSNVDGQYYSILAMLFTVLLQIFFGVFFGVFIGVCFRVFFRVSPGIKVTLEHSNAQCTT